MSADDPDDPCDAAAPAAALAAGLIGREPGALSAAVRLAGSTERLDGERLRAAIDAWLRRTGKSTRIGLVGLGDEAVDAFAARLVARGHRVAVLHVRAGDIPDGRGGSAGSGGSGDSGERDDRFDAAVPDEASVVAATLACEIGGFDTLLVNAPDLTPALAARVDCTVGNADEAVSASPKAIVADVVAEPPSPGDTDALDALWQRIERYRWRAVEDGTQADRRAAQRALW